MYISTLYVLAKYTRLCKNRTLRLSFRDGRLSEVTEIVRHYFDDLHREGCFLRPSSDVTYKAKFRTSFVQFSYQRFDGIIEDERKSYGATD